MAVTLLVHVYCCGICVVRVVCAHTGRHSMSSAHHHDHFHFREQNKICGRGASFPFDDVEKLIMIIKSIFLQPKHNPLLLKESQRGSVRHSTLLRIARSATTSAFVNMSRARCVFDRGAGGIRHDTLACDGALISCGSPAGPGLRICRCRV